MEINNNLIFEELSISNEVLQESQKIKDLIKQHLLTVEKKVHYATTLPTYQSQSSIIKINEKIFNVFDNININVKYFETEEDLKRMKTMFSFGGAITEEQSTLFLRLYGIQNDLDKAFLDNTLNHEMKHAFQIYMNKSFEIGDLYKKAVEIIQNQTDSYDYPILKNISYLIYFFNKREIDANMETYYQDLCHKNKNATLLNEFEMSVSMFEQIKDLIFDDDVCDLIKRIFGKTFKQILNYLNNNIEYFKTKKRKVFARYSNENRIAENYARNFNRFLL